MFGLCKQNWRVIAFFFFLPPCAFGAGIFNSYLWSIHSLGLHAGLHFFFQSFRLKWELYFPPLLSVICTVEKPICDKTMLYLAMCGWKFCLYLAKLFKKVILWHSTLVKKNLCFYFVFCRFPARCKWLNSSVLHVMGEGKKINTVADPAAWWLPAPIGQLCLHVPGLWQTDVSLHQKWRVLECYGLVCAIAVHR